MSLTRTWRSWRGRSKCGQCDQISSARSDANCWYSDGKVSREFSPQHKQYINREVDPTGYWLPSGSGLLSFCAPSVFTPSYSRAKYTKYRGDEAICIEHDEKEVPGLVAKIFIDPTTWLPLGWEQVTADRVQGGYYTSINTETTYPPEFFRWTPPSDAVDIAKVKRVSKLLPTNTAAPMLTFKDLAGKTVSMKSLLKGKKGLILNFWYYGCGWCQKEFPHLQELYTNARKQGLEVLLVNRGDDSAKVVNKFLKATKFTMPVALTGKEAVKKYGVVAFPTNYVINPEGKIVYVAEGYGENLFADMVAAVRKLGIMAK